MLLLGAIIISIAHRPHSCRYYYSFYLFFFFFDFFETFCDHQSFLDGPGRIPVLPHTFSSFSIQAALKKCVCREKWKANCVGFYFLLFLPMERRKLTNGSTKNVKNKSKCRPFFQLGRPSFVSVLLFHHAARQRVPLSMELVIVTRSALFCDGPVKTAFDISKDASRDLWWIGLSCRVSSCPMDIKRERGTTASWQEGNRKEEAVYINKLGNNHNNSASVLFLVLKTKWMGRPCVCGEFDFSHRTGRHIGNQMLPEEEEEGRFLLFIS